MDYDGGDPKDIGKDAKGQSKLRATAGKTDNSREPSCSGGGGDDSGGVSGGPTARFIRRAGRGITSTIFEVTGSDGGGGNSGKVSRDPPASGRGGFGDGRSCCPN